MPRLCRRGLFNVVGRCSRIFCFIDRLRVSLRKGGKENRVTAILLTAFFRLLDDIFLLLLLLSYHSSEICREELVNQLSLLRTVVTEKEIRLMIVWLFFEKGGMQLSLGTFFAFYPELNAWWDQVDSFLLYYFLCCIYECWHDLLCVPCRSVGAFPSWLEPWQESVLEPGSALDLPFTI